MSRRSDPPGERGFVLPRVVDGKMKVMLPEMVVGMLLEMVTGSETTPKGGLKDMVFLWRRKPQWGPGELRGRLPLVQLRLGTACDDARRANGATTRGAPTGRRRAPERKAEVRRGGEIVSCAGAALVGG